MKKIISSVLLGLLTFAMCVFPGSEPRFGFVTYGSVVRESVQYARKTDKPKSFEGAVPSYSYPQSKTACGPVAGAIVLGFYDRLYPELIPNFESFRLRDGKISYNGKDKNVEYCVEKLIETMNAQNGATSANIQSGLTSYVKEKGYKTSIKSCMDNYILFKLFNFSKYKDEIDAGRPVILCLKGFNVTEIIPSTTQALDTHSYITSKQNHAVVGFGYRTVNYTRYESKTVWSPVWYNIFRTVVVTEEVTYRSDTFLMIQTGEEFTGLLNINKNVDISDAYGINISK